MIGRLNRVCLICIIILLSGMKKKKEDRSFQTIKHQKYPSRLVILPFSPLFGPFLRTKVPYYYY